jgi:two-component sensor histidine kinase
MAGRVQDRQCDILAARSAILERIARNEPIDATLVELCKAAEALVPEAVAGVCVLDRAAQTFKYAIFPRLGETYTGRIPGLRVADQPGSCAVAIYKGVVVTSNDIASDKRFKEGWRELSLKHGIRSIQSRPFFAPDGTSLGTFVLGFREPKSLDDFDEEVAAAWTDLAGLALTRDRHEQQHVLLVEELQHRTRNLFATIGAIVYSTLRNNPDPISFRRIFDGRLSALARAHSIGINGWDTDLRSLLNDILAPHGDKTRIEFNGPQILLAQNAAAAVALAANELATNATKYGALSTANGKLFVEWNVATDAQGEPMFEMQWIERGGPPPSPSPRSGFGRKVIEEGIRQAIDGSVEIALPSQGLICTIKAPLMERLGLRHA